MMLRNLYMYIIIFVVVLALSPLVGSETISLYHVFSNWNDADNSGREILFMYRLPRTLLSMLCGGGLAMAGAAFQAIFRNSLVEPYTLGIAGGAAVGAYLVVAFPVLSLSWGVFGSQQLFTLFGAMLVMLGAYRVAAKAESINPQTLLLGGLTISIMCSGIIALLSYMSSPHQIAAVQRWMLGGFDYAGYMVLISVLPLFAAGAGLLVFFSPALNILNIGDEAAQGLGVDTGAVYIAVFLGGGLLTAAVVSVAGPVAFIGLITPHIVRRFSGYDQRVILLASFLLGGSVLAVSDMIARSAMSILFGSPSEFPAGIITALIGGPIFIKMLSSSWR